MRKPRLYTRRFEQVSGLRKAQFSELVQADGKGEPFNDAFMDKLQKRRSAAFGSAMKLFAVQVPIFAFLLFSLIPIQGKVTILGVSPEANRNLREVLIVVSAMVGLASCSLNYYYSLLGDMIGAYVEKRSKGNREVKEFLGLAYNVDYFILPHRNHGKDVELGWGFAVFVVAVAVGAASVFALVILAAFAIHVAILHDIFVDPSFSTKVSIATIAFVVLCDLLSISLGFLGSGVLGVRDYQNWNKLRNLPDEDQKPIYKRMVERVYRYPRWMRAFVRPKVPRKLKP